MKTLYRLFPIMFLAMPVILFLSAVGASKNLPGVAGQLAIAGAIALVACAVFLRDASTTRTPS